MNYIMNWFSTWVCRFIVIDELQFLSHESFICLQNNILVMLSVLNSIPDLRSSKTCMWTVAFLKLRTISLDVLTRS